MSESILVLLVEDSLTQVKYICSALEEYGLQVITAEDGIQALSVAAEMLPNFIILDVNLPKLDGYQVCYRLKRDDLTQHIPVVMLTSADSAEAIIHGIDVGADDYIPKDEFTVENVVTTIDAYLNTEDNS